MKPIISDEDYTLLWNWTRKYIDEVCIWRSENGERIPAKESGSFYIWQFYLRRGLFNGKFANAVAMMYLRKMQDEIGHFNFQLAGPETAATPLVSAIGITAYHNDINLNTFSVRKEKKSYGLQNWIEGIADPNIPVMLCDDLCNSQTSMANAKRILESQGFTVMDKAFAVVNKKYDNDRTDKTLPRTMEVVSLFNLDDFDLVDYFIKLKQRLEHEGFKFPPGFEKYYEAWLANKSLGL